MINISSAMINVQVIAPPEVQVVASPLQVILGGSTTLFCNVTRTNPGIVGAYIWRNENTGERILENSNTLLLNLSVVTDYGTYSCMVTNSAGEVGRGNVTITKQEVTTTESFLQLRISPVDNCASWTERNHYQKQADLTTHISNIIRRACSCSFNVTESVFSCRSSETQVVFKARLSYTSPVGTNTADDLVTFFSSWIGSGSSITVTGTIYTVDPTCPTKLESLIDEDCINSNSPGTVYTVTPTCLTKLKSLNVTDCTHLNSSGTLNLNIIWACAFGGGVVIITITAIVLIIILRHTCRRKTLSFSSAHELQPTNRTNKSPTPPEYEVVPVFCKASDHNPTVEPNIAYGQVEFIQQQNSSRSDPNTSYQDAYVYKEEPVYD